MQGGQNFNPYALPNGGFRQDDLYYKINGSTNPISVFVDPTLTDKPSENLYLEPLYFAVANPTYNQNYAVEPPVPATYAIPNYCLFNCDAISNVLQPTGLGTPYFWTVFPNIITEFTNGVDYRFQRAVTAVESYRLANMSGNFNILLTNEDLIPLIFNTPYVFSFRLVIKRSSW